MFTDPGKKIKNVAIASFWIVVFTSVILAFALGVERHREEHYDYWNDKYEYTYETEFHAAPFFGFLFGVPLCAYISALFLVGFGEIVESSEVQRTALEQPKAKPKEASEKEILDEGGWKCVCGHVNQKDALVCICGKTRHEGESAEEIPDL